MEEKQGAFLLSCALLRSKIVYAILTAESKTLI
jgi:hypothetical protein